MKSRTDWWVSTKSSQKIFRPEYRRDGVEDYLRRYVGVDSAILAEALGLSPVQVEACQRELGLRKITGNVRKGCR
jgi:hypothetical protein